MLEAEQSQGRNDHFSGQGSICLGWGYFFIALIHVLVLLIRSWTLYVLVNVGRAMWNIQNEWEKKSEHLCKFNELSCWPLRRGMFLSHPNAYNHYLHPPSMSPLINLHKETLHVPFATLSKHWSRSQLNNPSNPNISSSILDGWIKHWEIYSSYFIVLNTYPIKPCDTAIQVQMLYIS